MLMSCLRWGRMSMLTLLFLLRRENSSLRPQLMTQLEMSQSNQTQIYPPPRQRKERAFLPTFQSHLTRAEPRQLWREQWLQGKGYSLKKTRPHPRPKVSRGPLLSTMKICCKFTLEVSQLSSSISSIPMASDVHPKQR